MLGICTTLKNGLQCSATELRNPVSVNPAELFDGSYSPFSLNPFNKHSIRVEGGWRLKGIVDLGKLEINVRRIVLVNHASPVTYHCKTYVFFFVFTIKHQ